MLIRSLILILLAGTIILMASLRFQGAMLITPAAPNGILSLEFSHDADHTAQIASEWVGSIRNAFYINMLLDFFFIIFYGSFFYVTCWYIALLFPSWKRIAISLANAIIFATAFDVIENLLMIYSIKGNSGQATSLLTTLFATLKFLIVAACLLFIIFAGIIYLYKKRRLHKI